MVLYGAHLGVKLFFMHFKANFFILTIKNEVISPMDLLIKF